VTPARPPKDQPRPPSSEQAATPPLDDRYRQTIDRDWIASSLMELQRDVGGHTETLKHISGEITALKQSVGRIEKIIIGATAVVVVVGGAIVWGLNVAKDLYIATHPVPAQAVPAPPAAQPAQPR